MKRELAVICLLGIVAIQQETSADPANAARGRAAAANAMANFNSQEAVEQNLMDPMMSDANMNTLDGSMSFSAQLACEESGTFLEVLAVPAGTTGDIDPFLITQDTDLDGIMDHMWEAPRPISGVCANGAIACNPGTWDNCDYMRWGTDAGGRVALIDTIRENLGACYCINSFCGDVLAITNHTKVLSDLGGGAAAAAASGGREGLVVSSSEVTLPVARYKANKVAACAGLTVPGLVNYRAMPWQLDDAAGTAAADPIYQTLMTSRLADGSDTTVHECSIDREIPIDETTINEIIEYTSGEGAITPCGPDCLNLVIGRVGQDYWRGSCTSFRSDVTFNVLRPDRVRSARLVQAVWDDWIQIRLNSTLIYSGPNTWTGWGGPPGACELRTDWNRNPNVFFTSLLQTAGNKKFDVRVMVAGGGEGYARAQVRVDLECRQLADQFVNSCNGLGANPSCTLREEVIDGVVTIDDFQPTGLSPLASTVTINEGACSVTETRYWWHVDRVFVCEEEPAWDLSEAIDRNAHVQGSVTSAEGSGTLIGGYEDRWINPETGDVEFRIGDITIPDDVADLECTPMCKTRRPRYATDLGGARPVVMPRSDDETNDVLYKECVNDVCELEAGEVLVTPCGCSNEFINATLFMSMIRTAGGDMVCSSGVPANMD